MGTVSGWRRTSGAWWGLELERAPEMVAAYDLLSDVCLAKKDAPAAQAALESFAAE